MNHSFNVEIATKFGILEAILIENIRFWTAKNQANGTHYYDGYYWVYNSARAFAELFPYASENKIRNALKRLVEAGILQTGNYNKLPTDRTLWYAFTDFGISILQNQQIDLSKIQNGFCNNYTPLPIINPVNNNPVINTDNKHNIELIITEWNKLPQSIAKINDIKPHTTRGIKTVKLIKSNGIDAVIEAIRSIPMCDFLCGKNSNGWTIFYDWFINPSNFTKVVEGNYRNKSKPGARPVERDPDLDAIF